MALKKILYRLSSYVKRKTAPSVKGKGRVVSEKDLKRHEQYYRERNPEIS